MQRQLFSFRGGTIVLPARGLVLVDRADGGNLIVNPPREVWERSELTPEELVQWSFLVAAAGRAMIDVLPVLEGGCVNYWEAGNWALHEDAEPPGPKSAPEHRRVHLHLLGRSRTSRSASWVWGEAPRFPPFHERHAWAAAFAPLTADECQRIVARVAELLATKYGIPRAKLPRLPECRECGYPMVRDSAENVLCPFCRGTAT
jgi:hypothetical protein